MQKVGFADRQKLALWADTMTARADLPRLIRRLVLETTPGVLQVGMPADVGVSVGGWDGVVKAAEATAWVPAGLSLWELSVDKSPGKKADADYAKRSSTPDGSHTTEATYIAVSLRPWTRRTEWARDRTAERLWREVRAYGLDDIEAWVEVAPVTWAWLSEQTGLHPHGLRSAEAWWAGWVSQTDPPITHELLLAGRAEQAEDLLRRLDHKSGMTTVSGASVDEVRAFVAAVGVGQDAVGDGQLLARMAFIDDAATWRELLECPLPLVLVAMRAELASDIPAEHSHHIVVPVTRSTADVVLAPVDAVEAASALRAAGLGDDRRADEAGRLARRSLTALRRNIAVKPALHVPPWAATPVLRPLRAALLAGSWSDDRAGDQRVLGDLAGEEYEDFRERLVHLSVRDDPLVVEVAGTWHLVSKEDAWLLLREHLTPEDLQRLDTAVDLVLGERDPALELEPGDRWRASLEGKTRGFSGDLRQGLGATLALLGVHGEPVRGPTGATGTDWASHLVRKLLQAANEDPTGQTWASLSDQLALLAEAAPDMFLAAVRAGLGGEVPLLRKLFTDDETTYTFFSPGSPHSELLWALECLAWSPHHFGAAVDLLARLDAVDPGGRQSNRPFDSLVSIFCPWHPENSVTPDRRLFVVDTLRKRHPTCAWRLMISMLPEFCGIHDPTYAPKFRDWKPPDQAVTYAEYFGFTSKIVDRVIDDAALDVDRWAVLVERANHLPPADRARVIDALGTLATAGSFDAEGRPKLWQALRTHVGQHREFATAKWALPKEEVDRLEAIASELAPPDAYSRMRWLFTDQLPHIGTGTRRDDHYAYDTELANLRQKAVVAIYDESGLQGVRRLAAESVEAAVPWGVGSALADGLGATAEEALLDMLRESAPSSGFQLAHDYFARRFTTQGWPWLDEMLARSDLNDHQRARLLHATRDFPKSWQEAARLGDAVVTEFWELFQPFGLGRDFPDVEFAADRLMQVERFGAALLLLHLYGQRVDEGRETVAHLVARALEGLLAAETIEADVMHLHQWGLQELFTFLEQHRTVIGEDRVAELEWSYLAALGFDPNVPSLHSHMAKNPTFFVEIVSAVYRPHNRDGLYDENISDQERLNRERRALNAHRLLMSWTQVPGKIDDGRIDPVVLNRWVTDARYLLEETDRLAAGDTHIGRVLVFAPAEDGEPWPPEVVRDLVEQLCSEALEDGIATGLINRRGMTSRGLDEGGAQERVLISQYQDAANRYGDGWPRTAKVLRSVAHAYEDEARRNDDSAERFRQGLGG